MANRPWLSVLMPVYNGAAYLSQALESIALQADPDIECVLVDGDSTDSTLSIAQSYQDRLPLKILHRERESNWVIKTNHALSQATGEYACFLHHDDYWFSDRLNFMRPIVMALPQVALFLHPSYYIDSKGNRVGLWSCPLPHYPKLIAPEQMLSSLLIQNYVSIVAPIFKREAALAVQGMDENLWYTADWDFWLKISQCGDTLYYPRALSGFRIHTSSQTIVRSKSVQDLREQLEIVYNRYYPLWNKIESASRSTEKAARFSIEANSVLTELFHQNTGTYLKLFIAFLQLGPLGGLTYIRGSRIFERVVARLRAQLHR